MNPTGFSETCVPALSLALVAALLLTGFGLSWPIQTRSTVGNDS